MIRKGLLFIVSVLLAVVAVAQEPINVMSFNIRLNTSSDGINAWPNRVKKVTSQIRFHDADIFGVQEALHNQMLDLQKNLPAYNYVGTGRDDGKTQGEYSAIFYNRNRFDTVRSGTFWLSKNPDQPGSKDWDAAITRVCSWVELIDKKAGPASGSFYFFNTHFDHIGVEARKNSAELILQKIQSLAGNKPIIVTGDFNTEPDKDPYRIMTAFLLDAKKISREPHYGPSGTFTGFESKEKSDMPIDYIFVSKGVDVLKHATLSQSWQGLFSSDHYPVFARVIVYDPKKLSAEGAKLYEKRWFANAGDTLPYRILLPQNYDPKKQYPLILVLHGSGERGKDNEAQLVHGSYLFVRDDVRKNYPAIVVFPQCPMNSSWANVSVDRSAAVRKFVFDENSEPTKPMILLQELIAQLMKQYPVNKRQVYVGGLSMGGMGTFDLVSRNPSLFAAAFPICGAGNPSTASKLKNTKWWVFHGEADDVVPPSHSVEMVDAMKKAGVDVKLTIYPGVNHNSWDNAFAENDLLRWMFSVKK